MKLPNFKRLWEKDYEPDDQALIAKLSISINSGIEAIYQALSRKLTFADNMQSTIKDITIIVDNNGKPTGNASFKLNEGMTQVTGIIVIKCENLTNPASYFYSAPFPSWEQTQYGISISYITGLIPGHSYRVTFLAVN